MYACALQPSTGGDRHLSVGIAHGRRPPAFPRVPDCDGLRHIWAEDADYAVAFAGRVARRAARRATRCTRLAEETGLPAVYCTIRHDSRGSIMEDTVGAGELESGLLSRTRHRIQSVGVRRAGHGPVESESRSMTVPHQHSSAALGVIGAAI